MRTIAALNLIARAAGAALLLTGCGQSGDHVSIEDSEGNTRSAAVRDEAGTRTVTSDDGLVAAQGSKGGQNARFPDFAPQYPGASVQSAVDMAIGDPARGGARQHTIIQLTGDSADKVLAFYQDKAGGKQTRILNSATGPMLLIGGTTPLNMEAAVTATAIPSGGTSVTVTVQQRGTGR